MPNIKAAMTPEEMALRTVLANRQPRTAAGRALLASWLTGWPYLDENEILDRMTQGILAIEAEAAPLHCDCTEVEHEVVAPLRCDFDCDACRAVPE